MSHSPPLPLSVLIPVYNEDENIRLTLEALETHVPKPYELLICYDMDEDTTLAVVRPMLAAHPEWKLVKNSICRGPSGALRSGFAVATGERVLVAMADLCDDFGQIPQLMAMVPAQADVVCPSRYCEGGRQELKEGLKVWAPRTAGKLVRLLSGMDTHDPTNSFKMYSGPMLRSLKLVSTVSFSVTLEIVAKAHCSGYRVTEIPTVWRDRQFGKTNFRIWRSIVTYLPWFFVALMGARWIPLPRAWRRRCFAARAYGRTVTSPAQHVT